LREQSFRVRIATDSPALVQRGLEALAD